MKKFMSIMLVCLLMFTLAACKTEKTPAPVEDATKTTEQTEQTEQTATNVPEVEQPEATEEPTPEPTKDPAVVIEEKKAYYATYFNSEDMKVAGNALKMDVEQDGSMYTLVSSSKALSISTEKGEFAIISAEEPNQLYLHVKVYEAEGVEASDTWKLCVNNEEADVVSQFGGMTSEELFNDLNQESTTLEYKASYEDNGRVYDIVTVTYHETIDNGETVEDKAKEIDMVVTEDTHEIVRMTLTVEDDEDPEKVSTVDVDFIDGSSVFVVPADLQLEPVNFEDALMEVFAGLIAVMGAEF